MGHRLMGNHLLTKLEKAALRGSHIGNASQFPLGREEKVDKIQGHKIHQPASNSLPFCPRLLELTILWRPI